MLLSCMQVLTWLTKVCNVVGRSPQSEVILSLSKPVTADGLVALRRDVSNAVDTGATAILIDIDDIGILDSSVISTLVIILREARQRGGEIRLRAGRKSILETLRITALDKVFTIVATETQAAPRASTRAVTKVGRIVAALAAGLFGFGALLGAHASAQTDATPQDLVGRVIGQNADMQSYQAHVSLDFKLRSFPYVAQHLDGTTYYKRPDNFEVVFEKVPSYAKGFDKLYSDIDDPTSWPKRFAFAPAGERLVGTHHDVVIRLVQKVRGQIDHEDVAIDPVNARIDEMTWYYYNGGVISMDQEFEHVGAFVVLSKQHATIRIPFVHASAEAVYRDYRTNVAIDDAVFTRNKHE